MNAIELLDRLAVDGIKLRAVGEQIQARPKSAIGPDDLEKLRLLKAELLTLLHESAVEFFEERAAVREFDAKFDRADAELLAARDCGR